MTIQEINELHYLRIRILKLLSENGNKELRDNILDEFDRMYERFIYQNEPVSRKAI